MLFSVHEDLEHLAMIEKLFGPLSWTMVQNAIDGDEEDGTFNNIMTFPDLN
jgi:hypothetical protein